MDKVFLILVGLTVVWVIITILWIKVENDDFFRMKIFFREEYKYYKFCLKNKDKFRIKERWITCYCLFYEDVRVTVWDNGDLGIFKGNDCVFSSYFKKAAGELRESLKPKIEEYEKENKNKRNKSYSRNR